MSPNDVNTSMTRRERRRKTILLVVLLLLLALLAYLTYYFQANRRLPLPGIGTEAEIVQPPQYLYSITGAGAGALNNPVGVGIGPNDRVYVVDFGNRRISVFTLDGTYRSSFSEIKDGDATKLVNPVHLAIRGEEVWVTDRRLGGIYVFDLAGKFKREFLPDGDATYEWGPLALAFDREGELRVTDVGRTDQHRLLYFKGTKLTHKIGETVQVTSPEQSPAGFYFPNGVAVAADGRVFVSDGDNRRVQVFSKDGEFENFVDTSGVPRGIAIDAQQRLYVVDAVAHQVDVYDLEGERITQFGSQGFGPGQFNYPNDVAIGADGRIYITDRGNDQVQVWGWPVAEPPAIAPPTKTWQWALCLTPLVLLPLLWWLTRRRRYVVTPDFVDAIVAAGRPDIFEARRTRFECPEADHARYAGRVEDGVDLGRAIVAEPYSESDVRVVEERLQIPFEQAVYLAMSERARALLTDDAELRRLARISDIRVLNPGEYLETEIKPAPEKQS